LRQTLSKGRAGWGCLKQLTFNFVFSIKLNINLKNENVMAALVLYFKESEI